MTSLHCTKDTDSSADVSQSSVVQPVLVLVFLTLFVGLLTLSCAVYPGGNWIDRREPSHSFWRNLMCDLLQPIALNGIPNTLGSRLAQVSMLCFCVAVGAFLAMTAAQLRARPRLARVIRISAVCSLLAGSVVPFTPSQRFGDVHILVVFVAAVPMLLAGACSVVGFFLERARYGTLAWLGVLALALGFVDALVMAHQIATSRPITPMMPAIQRLTLLGVLAWMYPTALFALRRPRALRETLAA